MKVIFWDWNGTLVNDAPIQVEVFNTVVEPRGGTPVTLERFRELYRHPSREMYAEAGVDFSRFPFEGLASDWHDEYRARLPRVTLHGDAVPALESLRRRGARQMVLSALPHHLLVEAVREYSVDHFFEQVAGIPDLSGHSKVAQGIALLESAGVKGADVTIIGDSSHDAEVARELSAQCILVARGSESRRRLEANGFPVVESFESLILD